jgi:hypothetical protein
MNNGAFRLIDFWHGPASLGNTAPEKMTPRGVGVPFLRDQKVNSSIKIYFFWDFAPTPGAASFQGPG